MSATRNTLIVVAGPTAVGKSDVAVALARHFQTAILSVDARQCFKEMNIGTAKPSADILQEIPHYFIDSHSLHEEMSAGIFERYALHTLDSIFIKNNIVIACGGTGLYLNALLYGIDEMPSIDKAIAQAVNEAYQKNGISYLQSTLAVYDPYFVQHGNMENPSRMLRALVFAKTHQKSILKYRQGIIAPRNFEVIKIGLELPRAELYERINNRVDKMMAQGLLQEAQLLFPFRQNKNLLTVGYQEFYEYNENFPKEQSVIDQAVEKIKQHSRNYAKRQITWFKNKENFQWFRPDSWQDILEFVNCNLNRTT